MKKKKLEKWVASVMAGRLRQKEQSNLNIPEDMENYFDATVMAFVMVPTAPNKKAKERKYERKKRREAIKVWKREQKKLKKMKRKKDDKK